MTSSSLRLTVLLTAALTIAVAAPAAATPLNGSNPLGVQGTPGGNPLAGAKFFVDVRWGVANRQQRQYEPGSRNWLLMDKIARQPETHRFGGFTKGGNRPEGEVRKYMNRVADQGNGRIPQISIYRLKHVRCGRQADSSREQRAYRAWISSFAKGIGGRKAVLLLEQDALITTGCLSRRGVSIRMGELAYANKVLGNLPHAVTYMDGGASNAASPKETASLLRRARVRYIAGFFVNSTHYQWTSSSIKYGNRVSQLAGGPHFIVNTAVNGRGPKPTGRRGHEVLCNPSGRGLGPRPTTSTGFKLVDAFMWTGNPGRSGGSCVPGAPGTGAWWPAYALGLASRANEQLGPGYPSRPY